jgi:hypothetical protein
MRGIERCMPKPYEGFTDKAEPMKPWRFLTAANRAKTAKWVLCRLALLLLMSGLALAQGGVVNSLDNPLQVALLQWNKQDQPPAFGVYGYGISNPTAVAFDGANIWVPDESEVNGYNVTKLRAYDGANLGTFAVGTFPTGGMAFGGTSVWVANYGSNNVTKLRASDGKTLGTFAVGLAPDGLAFDGANIWVANCQSSNISKVRASDGKTLGTFSADRAPLALPMTGPISG